MRATLGLWLVWIESRILELSRDLIYVCTSSFYICRHGATFFHWLLIQKTVLLRTVYNFFIWCIACLHIEGKPTVSGRRMRSRGTSFPRITKFSLIAHSCPSFCDPVDCSTPGFPVLHQFPELAQTPVHLILCRPLLLLLSVFPSIRVFSNVTFASGGQILELQQQRQPFQWKFRVDFL